MNNSHDLIKRSQTFALERKCISIHSEDRDMSKYKNSNSFEVTLPETLRNVQTMCLAEISLPTNLYLFSNNYQNTKFIFSLSPSKLIDSLSSEYTLLNFYSGKFITIITSGSYTPMSFANEIQMQMNNEITNFINSNIQDIPASGSLGFKGTCELGTKVTADTSYISDKNTDTTPLTFSYQWQMSNNETSWSDIYGLIIDSSNVVSSIEHFSTALGIVSVLGTDQVTWGIEETGTGVQISQLGELSLTESANYQTKPSYSFTVTADDSQGIVATVAFAINVINSNTSPAIINSSDVLATINDDENSLGSVSADVPVTWSIEETGSGVSISSSGILTLDDAADYDTKSSYSFTVKATTDINSYVTTTAIVVNVKRKVIQVINIDATGVVNTILDDGSALGSVSSSGTDQVTWSIVETETGVQISQSGELSLAQPAKYQTKSSYFFTVKATTNDSTATTAIAINVTNTTNTTNEGEIQSSTIHATINKGGTSLGSVSFISDETETVVWSIEETGSDVSISSTGKLTLDDAADYETESSYSFTVKASVTSSSVNNTTYVVTKAIAVNVIKPVLSEITIDGSLVSSTIHNYVTALGSVSASGSENDSLTWSIEESGTAVKISQLGVLSLSDSSNYQDHTSYFFKVIATKNGQSGVETTLAFAINVMNPITSPSIINSSDILATINDGELSIGSVSADVQVTWSIEETGSGVSISSTGKLTLDDAADYETKSSYSFTVKATTDINSYVTTKAIVVNVTDSDSSTSISYTIHNNTDISSKKYIRLKAISTDSNDETTTLFSGNTEIIQADADVNKITGVIYFSEEGSNLTSNTTQIALTGLNSSKFTVDYLYQWQSSLDASDWTNITRATDASYTYALSDTTKYIRLSTTITYTPTTDAQTHTVVSAKKYSGYVNIEHREYTYDHFKVHFDSISQQLYVGNNRDEFNLNFDIQCDYDDICSSGQPEMWDKSRNWGLPYNMGFEQETYDDTSGQYKSTKSGIHFSSSMNDPWLVPDNTSSPSGTIVKSRYYVSPFPIYILCDDTIYMELEKYNTLDEMLPYSYVSANLQNSANCVCMGKTNQVYGKATAKKICSTNTCPKCHVCPTPYSNVGGKVNSAFAKIPNGLSPILPTGVNYRRVALKGEIQNVSSFAPPLDNVSKLKIKFRFHDGRLVEFGKFHFDFTLAIGLLTDEISRSIDTRVPPEYYM